MYGRTRTALLATPVMGWFRELANDWAFMLPIAEVAARPAVLPYPLYFYQPSLLTCPTAAARQQREAAIGAIMAMQPYCPCHGSGCQRHADAAGAAATCPIVLGRPPLVAVVGDANLEAERVGDREEKKRLAFEVGRGLAEAGCCVMTGGEGGVMEWASRGARAARWHRTGTSGSGGSIGPHCVALLRHSTSSSGSALAAPVCNRWVDLAIPTGLGHLGEARNAIIGTAANAIVAIGGGPGTLSEMCFAWMGPAATMAVETAGTLAAAAVGATAVVVVLTGVQGLSAEWAGRAFDRRPPEGRAVVGAGSAEEAVAVVVRRLRGAGMLLG
ncbi:hypothetical protein TSOC_002137 [Tetrabaena socialis]|uniref:LSDAT prokaryote domain-containing protein n=1 Tax=Tetrabaena socialis TaxID=47790 RepID=A0A2J8AEX8_9CHLO|nr:hypothetical protein TSOC_002137 [Tetrabaena socialis]|eukprot:PNH11074.1 hypothetical protein TSOC_002137 [Tetrabaena socialis]